MAKSIGDLQVELFNASDGVVACDAIRAITKQATKGNAEAKQVLALYMRDGRIGHLRSHACACLVGCVTELDNDFVEMFRNGLSDPELRYWSILGYIKSAGKIAYSELVRMARDSAVLLAERDHAIKCLAVVSRRPFDRNLPSDPGHWKESDLRLSEVDAWAVAGYPDGEGYPPPKRHPALDRPSNNFERVVSRLDKKLAQRRAEDQDLADPTDWLKIAASKDIERIKARWNLPVVYLDFLTRFSPLKVMIDRPEFYNPFWLFGASELIEAQDGYSFNPIEQQPIEEWPAHFVVIASHGGDPYVLDLSLSDGDDAPVETAEHGTGEWDFDRVADSFVEFLQQLSE